MSPIAQRRILSIQYLRGIAALAVVAHHTAWTHSVVGAAGVDLFFVISGFVMVHVSERESDPRTFLRARVLRLVPLYWLLTFASGVWYSSAPDHLLTSLAFWPHANALGEDSPVIPQGWSLNFEVFFYVVFALALLLPARVRVGALSVAFAVLVLVGLAVRPEHVAARVYTNPIIIEFLAGAWIREAAGRGWLRGPVLGAGLFALGAALLLAQAASPAPALLRALLWGGPCALIVAGAVGLELAGRVPSWSLPKLMGDSSYSLYLIQFFVLAPVLPLVKSLPAPAAIALAVAACAVVGLAVHWAVERPLQLLLGRLHRRLGRAVRVPAR